MRKCRLKRMALSQNKKFPAAVFEPLLGFVRVGCEAMKITQEVRDYADKQKAQQQGMEEKAIEFVKKGAKLYS